MLNASGTESSSESITDEHDEMPSMHSHQASPNQTVPSDSHLVKYLTPKLKASSKIKSLFQQLTPKKRFNNRTKQNLDFTLDVPKQVSRLQKRLQNHREFSISNFGFSRTGRSATLPNIHPETFANFSKTINKFCGLDSNLQPRCADHNELSLHNNVNEQLRKH